MLSRKLGWREIVKRPARAALTLMSVVIGVAAVVAVTFATQTARSAFDATFESIAGKTALEISATVGDSFDERVLKKIKGIEGIEVASPVMKRPIRVLVDGRSILVVVMGVDPALDRKVHDYRIDRGKGLANNKDVIVNTAFAENVGIKLNGHVDLLTRSGRQHPKVAGLFSIKGTAMTGQGAVLLMPLKAAQEWCKAPRRLDAIQIVLKPDASEEKVQAAIAPLLPDNATVHRPEARSQMAEEVSLSTEQGLNMARVYSLLISVFIIVNTFLISVTQRRRQFGILRAIGATKRQVAKMVLTQALTLGIVGTALGALVGVAGAHFLTRAMGSLYATELPPLKLTPAPFVWAVVFGVGMSVAGAIFPARKAMNMSPLDAIRDVASGELEGTSRWLIMLGGGLILVGGSVLGLSILGTIPMSNAVWSSVVAVVGVALLLPLALRPLAEMVAALMPTKMRVETRLAARYLLAHRARTTLTVVVVFAAITTGVGLANSVMDNVQDVRDWYKKTIIADFFVRATAPDMATGMSADMPDEVDEEIRGISGIESLDPVRMVSAKAAGQQTMLIVRDFSDPKLQAFEVAQGDEKTIRDQLQKGETVIGSVLAQRAKLKMGDDINLSTDKGDQKFRIAAVVNEYQAGGLTMYLERSVAEKVLGIGGVDAYVIRADHEHLEEVRAALDDLCQDYGLILQSFSDIQKTIDGMMAGVVAGLWGMVVVSLVVAAFGVANTLTMSVMEQTFELGLLRIIASTRNQIRTVIFAQAMMIGLLALIPGIFAGLSVAYLIHLATLPTIGHPVEFVVHPSLLLGGLAAGMAVVLLAAWGPAERAARIEVLEALRLR